MSFAAWSGAAAPLGAIESTTCPVHTTMANAVAGLVSLLPRRSRDTGITIG